MRSHQLVLALFRIGKMDSNTADIELRCRT